MPIGRGLSSLIPPQKETSDGKAPSKNAVVSPQRDETRLDSQPRSSDSRIGNPARSVSETLSHAPSHPPMDNDNYSPAASSRNAGGNIDLKISDGDHIFQIEVDKIKPNPFQPRHEFNDEELGNLAQSIREFGIIQPLIVSKVSRKLRRARMWNTS